MGLGRFKKRGPRGEPISGEEDPHCNPAPGGYLRAGVVMSTTEALKNKKGGGGKSILLGQAAKTSNRKGTKKPKLKVPPNRYAKWGRRNPIYKVRRGFKTSDRRKGKTFHWKDQTVLWDWKNYTLL